MHITDVAQIILPSALCADSLLPCVDKLQNSRHYWTRERRRALWEPSYQFIQKLLGRDLEVEGVATMLDKCVKQS